MAVIAGAAGVAAALVVRSDAPALRHGLVKGRGLAGVIVSILAGLTTIVLVWRRASTPRGRPLPWPRRG